MINQQQQTVKQTHVKNANKTIHRRADEGRVKVRTSNLGLEFCTFVSLSTFLFLIDRE
jgi:hypothetical protein